MRRMQRLRAYVYVYVCMRVLCLVCEKWCSQRVCATVSLDLTAEVLYVCMYMYVSVCVFGVHTRF